MRAGLAAVLLLASCAQSRPDAALPEFAMEAVEPAGTRPFGRADMLGKVWIAGFVFTRCAGPCPLITARMSRVSAQAPGASLLTVTVDPEGDTPRRLRAYARAWKADPARWVFLRGSLPETYRLLYEGFRLPLSVDPAASPERRATHSSRLVLVGRDGRVRGWYDALSDLENAALARDARRLLEDS